MTASWHFDDIPRILTNPTIHLSTLTQNSLARTFYSIEGSPDKLYRPVACLTFGLNWLIGNDEVFGYHLVNLLLHLLTGVSLYHSLLLLYQTPVLRNTAKEHILPISFLATLIWALHPIHTQAVTYIVQRMCVMAALFSVLGILFYLKYRLSTNASSPNKKKIYLSLLALCYLLAMGSKENAILLPATLLLIELIFFFDPKTWRKHSTTIISICVLVTISILIILAISDYWQQIPSLRSYENRFFTVQERLLTESRILIFYLSQLFYPIPQRLSISHDIQISSSLTDPVSTLLAFALIGSLVSVAIKKRSQWPVFSFSILFFFLNHLVESTVIPLELIFEHRNYLPSLFLFWPLAVFFRVTIPSLFTSRWFTSFIWKPAIGLLIVLLGISTFSRNNTWQTEDSLWQDAHNKAPGRARPLYYMGVNAAEAGDINKAIEYFQGTVTLTDPSPIRFRSLMYNQMAELQLSTANYNGALDSYQNILKLQPDSAFPVYKLAETYFIMGDLQRAEHQLRKLIREKKAAEKTHALLGKILLLNNNAEEALTELAISLQKKQDQDAAVDFAIALTTLKRYREAQQITDQLFFHDRPNLVSIELLQMVIQVATKQPLLNKEQADQFISMYPLPTIQRTLRRFIRSGISPESIQPIHEFLTKRIEKQLLNLFTAKHNEQY